VTERLVFSSVFFITIAPDPAYLIDEVSRFFFCLSNQLIGNLEMNYKGYKWTSEYSAEDGCYYGQIAYISELVTYEGESLEELEQAF
jgi:hypothetical protein